LSPPSPMCTLLLWLLFFPELGVILLCCGNPFWSQHWLARDAENWFMFDFCYGPAWLRCSTMAARISPSVFFSNFLLHKHVALKQPSIAWLPWRAGGMFDYASARVATDTVFCGQDGSRSPQGVCTEGAILHDCQFLYHLLY
jgi:hypothetical protein